MLFLYFFLVAFAWLFHSEFSFSLCIGLGQCLTLHLDASSAIFLASLSIISSSVLLWAFYYLDSILSFRVFFSVVLCFLCSMVGLIISGSLITMLVFWDLLGFSSFFLVLYYRTRSSVSGAILTGMSNRLGDCLLLSFLCFYLLSGSTCSGFASFLLLLVAFTKSAQVPFSAWLPAAIVAPTPVSALVHSSTLVTAGVFLLYRFLPYYTHFLLFSGILTSLIAGLSALVESDINNIVALSTLSQLGLIVTCLGLQQRTLAFSHLILHATFKALLFISVGIMIHSVYGSQSFRNIGTLVSSSWLVGCSFMISSLSLCGLVFMSGWCTKESLLAAFYSSSTPYFLLCSFYFGFFLTLAYSFRLIYYSASVYKSHVPSSSYSAISASCKLPLLILCSLSIIQGWLLVPYINLASEVLSSWVTMFYWSFWVIGGYFGIWTSQGFQGYSTALSPLYSSTVWLASPTPQAGSIIQTENTIIQSAGLASLRGLVLLFSRSHSIFSLCWVSIVLLVVFC